MSNLQNLYSGPSPTVVLFIDKGNPDIEIKKNSGLVLNELRRVAKHYVTKAVEESVSDAKDHPVLVVPSQEDEEIGEEIHKKDNDHQLLNVDFKGAAQIVASSDVQEMLAKLAGVIDFSALQSGQVLFVDKPETASLALPEANKDSKSLRIAEGNQKCPVIGSEWIRGRFEMQDQFCPVRNLDEEVITDPWENLLSFNFETLKEGHKMVLSKMRAKFAYIDGDFILPTQWGHESGVFPALSLVDPANDAHFNLKFQGSLVAESIVGFVEAVLSGKVPKYVKSFVPSSAELKTRDVITEVNPVPIVTANSFSEIVLGKVCLVPRQDFWQPVLSPPPTVFSQSIAGFLPAVPIEKFRTGMDGETTASASNETLFGETNECTFTEAAEKDVTVLFSATGCGFCRRMELIFTETYRSLRSSVSSIGSRARASSTNQGTSDSGWELDNSENETFDSENFIPRMYRIDCVENDCVEINNVGFKVSL